MAKYLKSSPRLPIPAGGWTTIQLALENNTSNEVFLIDTEFGQVFSSIIHKHEPSPSEATCIMAPKIEFSPAMPLPPVFDVQERIKQLYRYLDPEDPQYERKEQHTNIKAAIKLYEEGKIDGLATRGRRQVRTPPF
jgi:hypothetical protein